MDITPMDQQSTEEQVVGIQEETPQEPAAQQGQEQQETPNAQPEYDPAAWSLKVRGQTVNPKTRDELIALAQKGYDYNTSVHQLKQQSQGLEEKYGRYKQLDTLFEQYPDLAQQIAQTIQTYDYTPQGQSNADPAVHPAIAQQLQELQQFKQQFVEKQADDALDGEINELKRLYPDQPWTTDDGNGTLMKRVLKHAYDGNFPNLNAAYRDYMWDSMMTQQKADGLKAAQKQREQQQNEGVVSAPGQAGPGADTGLNYQRGDSYDSLAEKAMQFLGN